MMNVNMKSPVFISILILFPFVLYISISNLLVFSNIYVLPLLINEATREGGNIFSIIFWAYVLLAMYYFLKVRVLSNRKI